MLSEQPIINLFDELESNKNNQTIWEIYELGEFNKTISFSEINKYLSKLGVQFTRVFISDHNDIPENEVDALDPYYSQGKYEWKFIYNDVYVRLWFQNDLNGFEFGEFILMYPKDINTVNLECTRADLINWFSCPTFDAKNYNEFMGKYGISYYTSKKIN